MSNQLLKGRSFSPGDTVDAADLNNLVDLATALEGIISAQGSPIAILNTDQILFLRGTVLHRANVSTLPGAGTVTSVAWDSTYPQPASVFTGSVQNNSTTPQIRLSLDNQGPNKVLIGPVSGTATAPSFRVLTPADLPSASVQNIAAAIVDCTLGSVFFKSVTAAGTTFALTVKDLANGQSIRVRLTNDSGVNKTITWSVDGTPAIVWPGGTHAAVMQPAWRDVYTFTHIDSLTYATFDQHFIA